MIKCFWKIKRYLKIHIALCLGIVLARLFISLQREGHGLGSVVFAARNKNTEIWGFFPHLSDDITGAYQPPLNGQGDAAPFIPAQARPAWARGPGLGPREQEITSHKRDNGVIRRLWDIIKIFLTASAIVPRDNPGSAAGGRSQEQPRG